LRFVYGHTLLEFRGTVHMVANGKLSIAPLLTAEMGLEGVGNAFTALKNPEVHAKILSNPRSSVTVPAALN